MKKCKPTHPIKTTDSTAAPPSVDKEKISQFNLQTKLHQWNLVKGW